MLRYCANLKAIRYESTSLNRIVADKSYRVIVAQGDSFFHNDEQPELNLENEYPNKTGYNLKTNGSISIL